MFLLRSAFWLALAFIIIAPSADMRDSAHSAATQAVALGTSQVSQHIESIECSSLECLGSKAVASAAIKSLAPPPTAGSQGKLVSVAMPVPRPTDLI